MSTDDQRLAWQLHQDGLEWTDIANELDCHESVARHAAREYETRTDSAATANQYALFDTV